MHARLRIQDFPTGKNFSFNIIGDKLLLNFNWCEISAIICNFTCEITNKPHTNQRGLRFFSGKLFYKSNRKLSGVCIA